MTREKRISEALELSKRQLEMILAGAMAKISNQDENLDMPRIESWLGILAPRIDLLSLNLTITKLTNPSLKTSQFGFERLP
jgi:hypothetical protein